MAKVLIVYHSLSGNTEAAAEFIAKGAGEVENTPVRMKDAREAGVEDVLWCDSVAIGSYDAFSYVAGMVKDFFDRIFYPTQGQITDKPYIGFISHGGGGRAIESLESLCKSCKLKKLADPILVKGKPDVYAEKLLIKAGRMLASV